MSNRTRKLRLKQKQKQKQKCTIYKSCDHVPCNSTMNKCTPSYCVPGSSRNWGHCNMANWGKGYEKYKSTCRDESKCTLKKTKKTRNTVDALTLHNKMPYIWRFLKPKTRKHMIELANKPVKEINIPYHIFPDILNNKNNKNNKKNKKKRRQYINNLTRNMSKRNAKLFRTLRKQYKDI